MTNIYRKVNEQVGNIIYDMVCKSPDSSKSISNKMWHDVTTDTRKKINLMYDPIHIQIRNQVAVSIRDALQHDQ